MIANHRKRLTAVAVKPNIARPVTWQDRQARVLANLTPAQRSAMASGAELVIVLDRAYVRGVDVWPTSLLNQRG